MHSGGNVTLSGPCCSKVDTRDVGRAHAWPAPRFGAPEYSSARRGRVVVAVDLVALAIGHCARCLARDIAGLQGAFASGANTAVVAGRDTNVGVRVCESRDGGACVNLTHPAARAAAVPPSPWTSGTFTASAR